MLQDFYREAKHDISLEHLQLGLIEAMRGAADTQSEFVPLLMTRKAEVHGRTPRQNDYLQAIQQHDITFGVGPAGTGKTYLAVACAVDALERETVRRWCWCVRRWRRASAWASCPATWRRKWIPTCARCTTRSTT